jgi:aspartate/methionine/tyrosine aminotransferase
VTADMQGASKSKELNDLYESLDVEHGDGDGGAFLFGWQCHNPFAPGILAAVERERQTLAYDKYTYVDQDMSLDASVLAFHKHYDSQSPEAVFCAAGATSALFALSATLTKLGKRRIHYIPPLYFTQHVSLSMLGIEAEPVADRHAFEPNFAMRLPSGRGNVLVLADPIWYAGASVPKWVVEQIAGWQANGGNLVLVDGSFQYMRWDHQCVEATALLDPALTIRLVSPTKSLAVHGYRFSYVLIPQSIKPALSWTYNHIYGSCSADTIAFGRVAMQEAADRTITNKLTDVIAGRHRKLRGIGAIQSSIMPDSGYFAFEEVIAPLPTGYFQLDGKYFDQPRYPRHAKLNLLSPSIGLILPEASSP